MTDLTQQQAFDSEGGDMVLVEDDYTAVEACTADMDIAEGHIDIADPVEDSLDMGFRGQMATDQPCYFWRRSTNTRTNLAVPHLGHLLPSKAEYKVRGGK